MDVNYIGENLLPGLIGRLMIWISLVAALASAVYYIMSVRKGNSRTSCHKTADSLYYVHLAALSGTVVALYYLIATHAYEYMYVWQYSSSEMKAKFMVSCFWAGQEGSYLIWAILQGITGAVIIRTAKDWKPWVMPVFLSGQIFLLTMVLGIKLGPVVIGGSPFELLRNMPQNIGNELFLDPNYLKMIVDGNGLNPLLENVWMIIHPPALFLGYAVTLVPFCFGIASLWRKEYKLWLKPALVWTLAAMLTLGIGIILGGRWAYESLTFGGFWAWDPVENASLVPWLLLIATLHTMIITSKRGHGYSNTYLFAFLSWFCVVYATYLTRSGVLGETSVHSFGVNELSGQMVFFCLLFLILPLVLLLVKRNKLPAGGSDTIFSRDFWMFLGSVVAALSAFQILMTTSLPVFNKLFGTTSAPPVDNIGFYNNWQLPFAVAIALTIAVCQYLLYGTNQVKVFLKQLLVSGFAALILTIVVAFADHIYSPGRLLLLFSIWITIVVSVSYIVRYINKTSNIGSALTHAGFGIFLLGVVLAFSNSEIISRNTSDIDLGKPSENDENLVLVKGKGQPMGDYIVTYSKSNTKGVETFYTIDFVKLKDTASGKIAFSVHPSVNRNQRMGVVYNPDTKHFLGKDIYTYINFASATEMKPDADGYAKTDEVLMNKGDTAIAARSYLILDSVSSEMKQSDLNNAGIVASFKVLSMKAGRLSTKIKYGIKDGQLSHTDGMLEQLNLKLRFEGVMPDSQAIRVGIYEKQLDYIVIRATIFPFISVLWIGVIIMFSGILYAMIRRILKNKTHDLKLPSAEEVVH